MKKQAMRAFNGRGGAENSPILRFCTENCILKTNIKKSAFTLAEVLITLGIIGVVAAMTLPALIQKNQQRETVVKLKKTYSMMSQAMLMMNNEYGSMDMWERTLPQDATKIFYDRLLPYLKIIKNCGYEKEGCIAAKYYMYSGAPVTNDDFLGNVRRYNLVLSDGSAISLYSNNNPLTGKPVFAGIYIDVNGPKPPNTFGKDMFQFNIYARRGLFAGVPDMEYTYVVDECLKSGFQCSQLVIMNDNLDYQNCPNEFKAGAKKCPK